MIEIKKKSVSYKLFEIYQRLHGKSFKTVAQKLKGGDKFLVK